jgi:hypothetical protein
MLNQIRDFIGAVTLWILTTSVKLYMGAPVVPAKATLVDIIMSQTMNYSSSTTGGHLCKISLDTAIKVAAVIEATAPKYGLTVPLVAAGIRGESDFDPAAVDPNNQDAKPGETPDQAILHTDIGIGQFDGATLVAKPEFKGCTLCQIEAKAYDMNWAIPAYCAFVEGLIAATKSEVALYPDLLVNTPNHDYMVLALQAYNSGVHGAAEMARAKGSFSYGLAWLQRSGQYAAILGT